MKVFVISDTHFGHENIIKYCSRPFRNAAEMDAVMIRKWNETVTNSDVVIHLGDFALGGREHAERIASQLHGKKILILGNHDHLSENTYRQIGFHTVSRFPILYDDLYLMSHAPLPLSETTCYFNCYGHIHNDPRYTDTPTSKCFCVERIGYRPVLLYETTGGKRAGI